MTNLQLVFEFIDSRISELRSYIKVASEEKRMWDLHIKATGLRPVLPVSGDFVVPPMFYYIENRVVTAVERCREAEQEIALLEEHKRSLSPCPKCGGKGEILTSLGQDDAWFVSCTNCSGTGTTKHDI